jgi:predicted nucleotidyltransferase
MRATPEVYRESYLRREQERHRRREDLREEVVGQVREAVARLAPGEPAIRAVYAFGSLLQPGRFRPDSDVDLAVDCDDPEAESRLWRALEEALGRAVDLRPRQGAVARAVATAGELCYAREAARP